MDQGKFDHQTHSSLPGYPMYPPHPLFFPPSPSHHHHPPSSPPHPPPSPPSTGGLQAIPPLLQETVEEALGCLCTG